MFLQVTDQKFTHFSATILNYTYFFHHFCPICELSINYIVRSECKNIVLYQLFELRAFNKFSCHYDVVFIINLILVKVKYR